MTFEILEPVLNKDNKPCWLVLKGYEKVSTGKTKIVRDKNGKKPKIINDTPLEEKPIFELKPEGLWQCQKCGCVIFSKPQRPTECYEDKGGCGRVAAFNPLTKIINLNRWKIPIWNDIPNENISMITIYNDMIEITKHCIIFPEKIQYKLYVLWLIASYKIDSFDTAPFLIFRGLIESGKTRALDLIRELGYRMVHTTGVTFAAMCRLTHFHGAGILIDEIDNKIDKRTEDGRKYLDFIKPSYRRGSIYTTADKEDQEETKEYKNYGFKAFAGEKGGYDEAVFSRSIDFQMEQDYPEIPELYFIQDELNEIQTKLLNYRYKFDDPEPLPIEFELQGRDREIFGGIIQTAEHIGIQYDDILEYIKQRKQEKIDEIQDTDEYMILKAIKQLENLETLDDAPEHITIKDIVIECGYNVDNPEEKKKKTMKVSYILRRKFFLKLKRINKGSALLLNDPKNERKLKSLFKRYKL